ncbi:MAG: hypothetical protein LKF43_00320 [Streptococcaceae bacterium]|jgi:hypothetical protein|nr:hypothetical protein [Streptococcaceae bacterium]
MAVKYKTKYSNVVPRGYVGIKIGEIRDCGAIKLEFPNSEQFWFLYRELEEVLNE